MSKQPPKQRTLEFFLQKPKTQGQGTGSSNPGPANKKSASAGTGSKTAKTSNTTSGASANGSAKPKPVVAASKKSPVEDIGIASSPLPTFPSSRSIPSDSRSISSGHSGRSGRGASRASSPPASEAPDVDMMDEDEEEVVRYQPARLKRKFSFAESDDSAPKTEKKKDVGSKRKSIQISSDEDDEKPKTKGKGIAQTANIGDLERPVAVIGGKQRTANSIANSNKAPVRPTKRRKTSDADDFIAPSDEEEDEEDLVLDVDEESLSSVPKKSSKSKPDKNSSALVFSSDEGEDEEDIIPSKASSKKKAKPRLSNASSNASMNDFGGAGTGAGMLTAAERRIQAAKEQKKAEEKPYDFLMDVMDKDEKRPGEEGYDPRTLRIPKTAWKSFTPFEVQFWEIKQNHYDTVLFFQKGKFYELYEDDARIGHQIFDLKLTQRVKMSMVGVPEMSFDFWANKFLARGYKVGKVEQAETSIGAEMRVAAGGSSGNAKAKGKELVKRVLNKVFTNGTLMDGEYLNDEDAAHCISMREEEGENKFGLAILDSSTSEFKLSSFVDDVCRTKLETLLRQLRPKEIILSKGNLSVSTTRLLKNVLPNSCTWTSLRSVEGYDYAKTLEELKTLYPPEDGEAEATFPEAVQSMIGDETAIEALGSMIWYLRTLNIDKALLSAKNFNIYDPMRKGQGLVLDGQTLAHIEVLMNSDGNEEGTLLKLIGRCVTPFGKRLFRIWLCMPLRDIKLINERLDAVEDLMRHETFEADFVGVVKGMPDLERIVSRIHAGTCKIKDFLKVLDSFKKLSRGLSDLAEKASSFETATVAGLLRSVEDLKPYLQGIRDMFEAPAEDASELVPQQGKDEEYDEISGEINQIERELQSKLKKFEKTLGIPLEFWHSATGTKDIYLVEAKAGDKNKVPKAWQKHNDTKAKLRFMVPEFAALIRKLKEARESTKSVIKAFTSRLYAAFDADRDVWLRTVRVTAELDCLLSLAKASVAIGTPSCRPEFVESEEAFVDFTEMRHPGIAMALGARNGGDFISNDVKMGGKDTPRIMLLTGPNMAGKSTLMRQTCVGVIMAQLGMYVPASSAKLAPVDAILTRMGAYDNMFSNSSTFKVELDECCKIIRDGTPRSLVILDELGRGTSTFDGIAIAGAVLHHLATHTLALSCFATHYSSLTNDYKYHPNIRTMHMATAIDEEKRELIWLYKLVEGVAPSSFGTHVASLAGVPDSIVERANTVSEDFSRQFAERLAGRTAGSVPVTAQVDLAYLCKLVTGKLTLDENKVRRREVLKILKAAARSYSESA